MMQRLENFEMAQRGEVECEEIIPLVESDASEIRGVAAKMLSEIVQHTTRSPDGCGAVLQAEAVERGDFEMFADSEEGGFGSKDPIVVTVDDPTEIGFGRCRWRRPLTPGPVPMGWGEGGLFVEPIRVGIASETVRAATKEIPESDGFARKNDFGWTQAVKVDLECSILFHFRRTHIP